MDQQLYIARVDHLFDQLRPALSSALFGITVATVLFWQQTGALFFLLWFGLAAIVGVARYLLYRRYFTISNKKNYHHWLVIYRILATSHGLLWSILALASLYYGGTSSLSLALIILAGVTAAAIATSAVDLTTFYSFSFVTLVPVSAFLLFESEVTRVWLGVMCGGFLLIMVQVARTYNRTFIDALRVRFENDALLQTLSQEKKELAHAKEKAERLADQLYELSARDGLTGLFNRRAFDEALAKYLAAQDHTVSLILCDIDHFKGYNDRYGHPKGDLCLKSVAAAFLDVVTRPGDMVTRYGGEEFGIILADTDAAGAVVVARKLRVAVKKLALIHEASPVAQIVTASFGVASTESGQATRAQILIDQADKSLYQAKAQGRDQVVVANTDPLVERVA